jgi:membrane-bound ClpP family serine protease
MNRDNFVFIGLGTTLIAFGVSIMFNQGYYSSKHSYYIDFGPFHIIIGALITVFGIFMIYKTIRIIKTKNNKPSK